MRIVNRIRTTALIAGAGAAAAYLLDPDNGRERRQRAVEMIDELRDRWMDRLDARVGMEPSPSEDRASAWDGDHAELRRIDDVAVSPALGSEPDLSAARFGSDPRLAPWPADVT